MVRIAPVRLQFSPKTLWFDAGDVQLRVGDGVVVSTARGTEYGTVSSSLFEMDYEDTKKLKSPLKPVKRAATAEDAAKAAEMADLSQQALPIFRQMAAEALPDMNPVAVEYLFEGDKAVFYFESEERVDFRDLVRKLASELHVRVDMKQIGVRDSARMVGGLGHCGQELCCARLGGEFNPVSIRMAKEQDLSLNPQKISGCCGRLMCCLRYEYDAYKDFHTRAPKKNARISTPDGEGKVVDMDVPREVISIKVGDEKPVKVPLADMEAPEEGTRPNAVGQEAWDRANEPAELAIDSAFGLFSSTLSGEDQLAKPGSVRHVHGGADEGKKGSSRSRRRGGSQSRSEKREGAGQASSSSRKPRRRRSTTVKSEGAAQADAREKRQAKDQGASEQPQQRSSSRRRRRSSSGKQQQAQQGASQQKTSQVGRNSSALRANRADSGAQDGGASKPASSGSGQRRRRRSHRTEPGDQPKSE